MESETLNTILAAVRKRLADRAYWTHCWEVGKDIPLNEGIEVAIEALKLLKEQMTQKNK